MKLLIAVPAEGSVPLLEFFGLLDEKQRQKLLSLFALLLQSPAAVMREPYVKHFCIERYQALYELRAKSKNLVRIIFTLTDDGDILFLTPFNVSAGLAARDGERAVHRSSVSADDRAAGAGGVAGEIPDLEHSPLNSGPGLTVIFPYGNS